MVVSNYHPPYLTPKNEVVSRFFQGSIHLVQKLETMRTGEKIPHETMLQHEQIICQSQERDPSVATNRCDSGHHFSILNL